MSKIPFYTLPKQDRSRVLTDRARLVKNITKYEARHRAHLFHAEEAKLIVERTAAELLKLNEKYNFD